MEVNKSTDHSISRRGVLCGIAVMALGLTADIAQAATTAIGPTQVGNKIKIDLAKNKALAKVGGMVEIDTTDGGGVAVVRTAAGPKGLVALSLTCPHMGAKVMTETTPWVCSGHGAEFSKTGKMTRPPMGTQMNVPLSKYPIKVTGNTVLIG
jgi:nitrite reductase/ring-hydroxylating ferredoxin subunit